jgi:hypothetical protein
MINQKFIATSLVWAAIAFTLSRIIWPDLPSASPPANTQMPFFIIFSIIEALAFGFGIAFSLTMWSKFSARFGGDWLAKLSFISVVWLLASWWPHDNMHRVTEHGDYWGLLKLEYGFHATLMLAGVILAFFLATRIMDDKLVKKTSTK